MARHPRLPPPPRGRNFLTPALVVAAVALGALLVQLRPGPVRAEPAPLARSPKLAWERVNPAPGAKARPRVSNVQVLDFDGDGVNDILVTDYLA